MYEMPDVGPDDADRRHLNSRKRYYIRVAMWSTQQPPDPSVLEAMVGQEHLSASEDKQKQLSTVKDDPLQTLHRLLCCTARESKKASATQKQWFDGAFAAWIVS